MGRTPALFALMLLLAGAADAGTALEAACANLGHTYKFYHKGVCYVVVQTNMLRAAASAYCMDEALLGVEGGTLALLPVNSRRDIAAIGGALKVSVTTGDKHRLRAGIARTGFVDAAAPDAGWYWIDYRTGERYPLARKAESAAGAWYGAEPNNDGGAADDVEVWLFADGAMLLNDIQSSAPYWFICQIDDRTIGMPVMASAAAVGAKAAGGTVLRTVGVQPGSDVHRSVDACAARCAALSMCTSFSLNAQSGECQLQSATYAQTASVNRDADGFLWFDLM